MTDFSPLFAALRDSVLLESEITTNALGNPIHSTEQGIENFWKWFSDSVMKNRKGQPCVFYHGSSYVFDRFIPQRIIDQLEGDNAVFFSTKKQFSVDFAQIRIDDDGQLQANRLPDAQKSDQKQIYECYLRCKKPFNFRNKSCIDQFIKYIENVEDRRSENTTVKSVLTGAYPYNFTNVFDEIKVGDILNIGSTVSPSTIGGSIKNDIIKNDIIPKDIKYSIKSYNDFSSAIVFKKGEKSLLAYGFEILDNIQLLKDKVILTKNSEVIDRIKSSGIVFKGSEKKRIPFSLLVGTESNPEDTQKIQVNIVIYRIFANKELAPLYKYPNNWQEIESLLINPKLSFVQVIKELGYDSFFTLEDGYLNIVVFNANDIKSVNNDGTFSESDKILS